MAMRHSQKIRLGGTLGPVTGDFFGDVSGWRERLGGDHGIGAWTRDCRLRSSAGHLLHSTARGHPPGCTQCRFGRCRQRPRWVDDHRLAHSLRHGCSISTSSGPPPWVPAGVGLNHLFPGHDQDTTIGECGLGCSNTCATALGRRSQPGPRESGLPGLVGTGSAGCARRRMLPPVPLGVRLNGQRPSGRVRRSCAWFTAFGRPVRADHLGWVPCIAGAWFTIPVLINPLSAGTGPARPTLACCSWVSPRPVGRVLWRGYHQVRRAALASTVRYVRLLAVSELAPGMWIESPTVRGEYVAVRQCRLPPRSPIEGCAVVLLSDLTTMVSPLDDDSRDMVSVFQVRDDDCGE